MTLLIAWLIADFLSGIVHWAEDRYLDGKSRFKMLNLIAADNHLHHERPQAMLENSAWNNCQESTAVALPLAITLFLFGAPACIYLALAFACLGNLIHRWAHTPVKRLPRVVRWGQRAGFLMNGAHHRWHHWGPGGRVPRSGASSRYCAMTPLLNPVLDRLGFWRGLERALARVGVRTR